jgi:hypothetical protein
MWIWLAASKYSSGSAFAASGSSGIRHSLCPEYASVRILFCSSRSW